MSIVSSTVKAVIPSTANQFVVEEHTDGFGVVHTRHCAVANGIDPTTLLASHAAMLEAELADAEAQSVLGE